MKLIALSQGKFAQVDDDMFDELNKFKWHCIKPPTSKTFYAGRNYRDENGKRTAITMHRHILGLFKSKIKVDHINNDGLCNIKDNLRHCTTAQNAMNTLSRGKSKYKGVSYKVNNVKYNSKKGIIISTSEGWVSQIKFQGKKMHLGFDKTEVAAAKKYNEAAKKYFGEFAKLNIIEE